MNITIMTLLITTVFLIHFVELSSHGPSCNGGPGNGLPMEIEEIEEVLGHGEGILMQDGFALSKARKNDEAVVPFMGGHHFFHYNLIWKKSHNNPPKRMFQRVRVSPEMWLDNLATYAKEKHMEWVLTSAKRVIQEYNSNHGITQEMEVQQSNTFHSSINVSRGSSHGPMHLSSQNPSYGYSDGAQAQSSLGESSGSRFAAGPVGLVPSMSQMNLNDNISTSANSPNRLRRPASSSPSDEVVRRQRRRLGGEI